MKYIPAALLLAEAVYLAFVPATLPHSLILIALSALFAFQLFLDHERVKTKQNAELAELKKQLENDWANHKEFYAARLSDVEGELKKIALNGIKGSSPSSSSTSQQKKYTF